jgi:hypothetical protein
MKTIGAVRACYSIGLLPVDRSWWIAATKHNRIFLLCHYFATTKQLWKNEPCHLGRNEMAGSKGKSRAPGNMNAFKHGLAAIQKRRGEGIPTEHEESVRQQILRTSFVEAIFQCSFVGLDRSLQRSASAEPRRSWPSPPTARLLQSKLPLQVKDQGILGRPNV